MFRRNTITHQFLTFVALWIFEGCLLAAGTVIVNFVKDITAGKRGQKITKKRSMVLAGHTTRAEQGLTNSGGVGGSTRMEMESCRTVGRTSQVTGTSSKFEGSRMTGHITEEDGDGDDEGGEVETRNGHATGDATPASEKAAAADTQGSDVSSTGTGGTGGTGAGDVIVAM
jgi:hypothetical protein